MGKCWVVNASPVITLAKAGYLDLLIEPSHETLLPEAVATEILGGSLSDPGRQALEAGWGMRVPAGAIPASILEWSLGAGESAVIATTLAQKPCSAVLDDAAARAKRPTHHDGRRLPVACRTPATGCCKTRRLASVNSSDVFVAKDHNT